MAEGRPLHGKSVTENVQDYVEERLEYSSDSNEIADADRALKQELADLQNVGGSRGATMQQPDVDALNTEAQLPASGMELAHGASQIEATGDGQVNYDHLAPQDEARARVARSTTDRGDSGKIGRG